MSSIAEFRLQQLAGVAGDQIRGGRRIAVVQDACDCPGLARFSLLKRLEKVVESVGGIVESVDFVARGVPVGMKAELLILDYAAVDLRGVKSSTAGMVCQSSTL